MKKIWLLIFAIMLFVMGITILKEHKIGGAKGSPYLEISPFLSVVISAYIIFVGFLAVKEFIKK